MLDPRETGFLLFIERILELLCFHEGRPYFSCDDGVASSKALFATLSLKENVAWIPHTLIVRLHPCQFVSSEDLWVHR